MHARSLPPSLVLLGLVAAGCSAPELWVIPRFQQASVDGDIASESQGQAFVATSLDELELDEENTEFAPRVDLVFGPHLSVSHLSSEFSGTDGTVSGDFVVDGEEISAGTDDVATDLDMTATNAALTWDLVPGAFELGLGLGVTFVDAAVVMSSADAGVTLEPDTLEGLPIPMLAARAGWSNERFQVGALVSGLEVDSDLVGADGDEEYDVSVFDFDLHAGLKLLDGPKVRGLIVAGFRSFEVDLEGSDETEQVLFDLEFGGPYVGVNIEI